MAASPALALRHRVLVPFAALPAWAAAAGRPTLELPGSGSVACRIDATATVSRLDGQPGPAVREPAGLPAGAAIRARFEPPGAKASWRERRSDTPCAGGPVQRALAVRDGPPDFAVRDEPAVTTEFGSVRNVTNSLPGLPASQNRMLRVRKKVRPQPAARGPSVTEGFAVLVESFASVTL